MSRIIDESQADKARVTKYADDVKMLCGLVVEMLETTPQYVLSPVLRGLAVEHAKRIGCENSQLRAMLCLDNPQSKAAQGTTETNT